MEESDFTRSEKVLTERRIETALKEYKKRTGEVVHIAISARTTFEFPAHLSAEERNIRIENYKKRHKMRIGGW